MKIENYILEIVYLFSLITFAEMQLTFIKTNQIINHVKWLISSGIIALGLYAINYHAWLLLPAFILERFVFFSQILNLLRHKTFFYIDPDDPHGSKIDKLLAKVYKQVWFVCVIWFILIQFFL